MRNMAYQKKFFTVKLLFVSCLIFIVFRLYTLHPNFSDEIIYINMARVVSKGLLPYKDFFYAHPPLHLFLLAPIASLGNFSLVKFFISVIGLICILLTYFITKKLYDEKTGVITAIAFLIFPGFLIFGNLAMGTFEALLFYLLSFYFLLNRKTVLSSIFLSLAIFTRYLVVLLVPILVIYLFKYQRKKLSRSIFYFSLINILSFTLLYTLFGSDFFISTILYHFQANIEISQFAGLGEQYLALGFFTIFMSLICLIHGYLKKDSKILLFAFYPLIYDLVILLIFKQVIYHYFAFMLPFIFVAFGVTLVKSKLSVVKFSLLTILALSFFTNLTSLNFYFNEDENKVFNELVDYTLINTNQDDLIFGSATPTNYVSFVTDRKIVGNYFDSDLKFISFYGKERVLSEVKNAEPILIFATQSYADFFEDNYVLVKVWNKPGYYHFLLLKKGIV